MFDKIELKNILNAFQKTKENNPKRIDLEDKEGKVVVYLRDLPFSELRNKYRLLGKLQRIVGTIGVDYEGRRIEGGGEIREEELSIPEIPNEVKEEKAKKLMGLLKSMGIEEEIKKKEEERKIKEEIKEEIAEEIKGEAKDKGKKEIKAEIALVNELVREEVKEEAQTLLIEDKETYSKVKEGVGISFIDNHKTPEIKDLCVELEGRDVVEEIYSSYTSKGVSKAELSKRLVELTRQFLKAKTKEERDKIREEILEVKQALKSKQSRKRIDPFEMLYSIQENAFNSLVSRIEEEFNKAIDEERNRYEEALSLNPSSQLKEEIEKLKENDLEYLKRELEEITGKCIKRILEKHSKEYESLKEKVGKGKEGYIEKLKEFYEEKSKEVKERILKKMSEIEGRGDEIREEVKGEVKKEEERERGSVEMVLEEIKSMGDASWLHYLGRKNRKLFWKYVRGMMNKEEALKKAKELYLNEKKEELNLGEEELKKIKDELGI